MKVKNKKETARNEFRRNKKTQHPAYVYAKVGNDYKYIGITHSEITNNMKNILLDKNPDPNDSEPAYALPITSRGKTNDFKRKEKDWRLSKADKQKMDKIKTQSKK